MATTTKRQPKVEIDIAVVRGPILTVWNAIAGDLDDAADQAGGGLDNTSAIEACIDAGRLVFFARGWDGIAAGRTAEIELDRAIDAYGYDRVLRKLAREIVLV